MQRKNQKKKLKSYVNYYIFIILQHYNIYSKISKQQPVLLSNISRANTYIRFVVEKCIGHNKNRYGICRSCPWYMIDVFGYILRYINCLHAFLKVGVLNDNEQRHMVATWFVMNLKHWGGKHPISRQFFQDKLKNTAITSDRRPDKLWQLVCEYIYVNIA